MSQQYRYPSSASVTVAAIGPNGNPIPTQSILIAGKDPTANLVPVKVAADGTVKISEVSPITGYALETTQLQVLAELQTQTPIIQNIDDTAASIDGKIIACDTGAVVVASSALPAGAATEATLSSINGKTPALVTGRVPVDGSGVTQPVSGTVAVSNFPATQPVSGTVAATQSGVWNITNVSGTVSLPTGASTETTLAAMSAKLPATIGQKAMAASLAVTLASDQSSIPVAASQSGTWNITNISGTVSLPTGAATEATLSTLNGKVPANLTVTSTRLLVDGSGVTQPVSGTVTVGSAAGRAKANTPVLNDYSSSPVTSAAYVQLIASTTSTANMIEIFDSSGQTLYLAVGAAASEVNQLIIVPGGNGQVPIAIPSGSRVSVKATSTSATIGILVVNLYT